MNQIKRFNSIESFNDFFKKNITNNVLGKGSEGICYLGKDGLAYKKYYNNNNKISNYNYDKFITTKDCNVDTYAFPIDVFCIKEKVVGYTSKLVKQDLLLNNCLRNGFDYKLKENKISYSKNAIYEIILNSLKQINFNKMARNYKRLYEDTLILSDKGIKINDLKNNIMYDGDKFMVVDTGNYIKTNERVARRNIKILESALKDELEYIYVLISNDYINKEEKIYSYIKKIGAKLNEEYFIGNEEKKLILKK